MVEQIHSEFNRTIEVVLKYVGGGAFLVGIPARDLTAAEVKEHGGIVELCKTGLYERVAKAGDKVTKELAPKDGE